MRSEVRAEAGTRPVVVCVLGPGRSGTSLTMRLLGLSGVNLGLERDLLSRTGIPANPKGFWEHRGFSRINQCIFSRLGGSWSEPPPLPPGWERAESLAAERSQAGNLLRTFDRLELWGWKDGRNSLTLPFWQQLLPPESFDVRYVVCLRNPVDFAASLVPPRPLSRSQTVELWLTYVASALANTAGRSRLLLSYESYFQDWRGAVERLLGFAGCEAPAPGSEAEARLIGFTDSSLWRHRTTAVAAMHDPAVSEAARSLYLIAELLSKGEPPAGMAEAVDAYAHQLLGRDGGEG